MNVGDLVVKLRADLRNFTAGMTRATTLVKGFAAGVSRHIGTAARAMLDFGMNVMRRMALAVKRWAKIAGLAILGIGIYATKLASDLEQTESRFNIVFGDMADAARRWSYAFADSLRQNRTDIQGYLATFQKMTESMGFTREVAFGMSKTLVKLATDMSAFEDIEMDEAFNKITSALAGMPQPMQRLGYDLRQAAVEEEGLRIGLIKTGEQMTEQQKVVARLSQMVRVMSASHDNARITMEEAAPTFRATWAQIRASLETIGTAILPVVADAARALREWLFHNQMLIAKWGEKVGATLKLAGEAFIAVVKVFQKAPSEGFDLMLDALVEVIEAAGKIAMDMALRIGKGIWQGVKEGIFGENEAAIRAEAKRHYELAGGRYMPEKFVVSGMGPGGGGGVGVRQVPNAPELWEDSLRWAREQAMTERRDSIWAGFGDTIKRQTKEALADIQNANEGIKDSVGEATKKWKEDIAAIDEKYANLTDETMPQFAEAGVNATDAIRKAMEGLTKTGKKAATDLEKFWGRAAGAIEGSMEDAFVSITKNVRNATDAILSMLNMIQDAISRSVFQTFIQPGINTLLSNLIPGYPKAAAVPAPTVQIGTYPGVGSPTGYGARGGMVYAQAGAFTPRGTDTIPAMLTPGEGVLDAETTARLRKILAVPEPSPAAAAARTVNVNIYAMDSQDVYRALSKNKRQIASLLGDVHTTNHPIRRMHS